MESKTETKTVKKSRRKYDAEFKKEVIKMIEAGRSVPDVGEKLGIGTNLIYQWIRQSKQSENSAADISFNP